MNRAMKYGVDRASTNGSIAHGKMSIIEKKSIWSVPIKIERGFVSYRPIFIHSSCFARSLSCQ